MKKNYLLSAAAAFLLAVTGCSDDIENGGNSGGEDDGGKVYMTVNVSTVSKATSKGVLIPNECKSIA